MFALLLAGVVPEQLVEVRKEHDHSPIAELPAQIHSILASAAAANVSWGILIRSEKLGTLFALNANHSFVPVISHEQEANLHPCFL